MTSENDLLEMSKHFKTLLNKKNLELERLKKCICMLYGLIRVMDESEDISFIEILRSESSKMVEEICNIDNGDIEDVDVVE
jgi:hypothetical protein